MLGGPVKENVGRICVSSTVNRLRLRQPGIPYTYGEDFVLCLPVARNRSETWVFAKRGEEQSRQR